jgi:hypothetical protein
MTLSRGDRAVRYAGAAFVVQFVTSLTAGLLSGGLTATPAETLADVAAQPDRWHLVVVLELVTSVAILALASALLVALASTSRPVACWAFALWCAEAVALAMSMVGVVALLDLSASPREPVAAGVADLALALRQDLAAIDMLFFSVGGVLWYALMHRARLVPRWLSVWAIASVTLVLVASVVSVCGRTAPVVVYLPYVPVELVVGVWLLARGRAVPGEANAVASYDPTAPSPAA